MKPNILVVSTHNSVRSQMAEAFLRLAVGDRYDIYSAGFTPRSLSPLAIQVMREIGIDIRQQSSKDLCELLNHVSFCYVISLCAPDKERCPAAFPGAAKLVSWSFPDPTGMEGLREEIAAFRLLRDQIRQQVNEWVKSEKLLP